VGSFSQMPAERRDSFGLRAAVGVGATDVLNKTDLKTWERYWHRGELPGVGGREREGFVRQVVGLPG
jgi:hypothetical protein